MISSLYTKYKDTKLLVHIFVCVFAIASWANLNGMWVELPILVLRAPEGWDLPSYIVIISQVANIGPLIVVLISFFCPKTKGKLEIYTSGGIIILSIVSSFLLAFLWEKTSYVAGAEHSTSFLTLSFFMSFGDCISSVTFYAFMAMMKPVYMTSLFIGEGFSGMLPAMIALGQGAGDIICVNSTKNETQPNSTEPSVTWSVYPMFGKPGFSVQVYFILISIILVVSFISFVLLNVLPYCRTEFISSLPDDQKSIIPNSGESEGYGSRPKNAFDNPSYMSEPSDYSPPSSSVNEQEEYLTQFSWNFKTHWKFLCFQGLIVWINMTRTTFLPTIQDYSTLPFGLHPYHLATTLSQIATPVACLFALVVIVKSLLSLSIITLLGQVCTVYIIYLAAMGVDSPLHGEHAGGNVAVTVWVVMTLLLAYAKVSIAGVMRTYGRRALICTGVSTQVGSLIGAIVGYLLVSEYHVFNKAPYC